MQFQGFDWFTYLPCEKFSEISPRSGRVFGRRDYWRNLGGQKRAEISGEISAAKTSGDYWRDLGETSISTAKNALRLVARSR